MVQDVETGRNTHKESSSDQAPHEPDLQADVAAVHRLAVGEEEQEVGDHTGEGSGQ